MEAGSTKEREQEIQRLRVEIEKKHGKTPEELRDERVKRVRDAIELREPDRVPVMVGAGIFAARYGGLSASAMYYDHAAYREACQNMLLEIEPDTGGVAMATSSGPVLEALNPRHQAWPGGNLPPEASYQFIEGEYMKPNEYDIFINDPSDFIMRYYFPRIYGALEPLAKLPPLGTLRETGFVGFVSLFARPEFQQMAANVFRAAQDQERLQKEGAQFASEMERLGFPAQTMGGSGIGGAPFDAISDLLRGLRGIMLDMYQRPDKLLAACDKVLECRIAQSTPADPNNKGLPQRGGGPLHRGSDGFMSLKQFEQFYWPGLRKSTWAGIDRGFIVSHFYEGHWEQRLEYLLEFPKGKMVFHCEQTDILRAKEVLGDRMCIQGGVHPAMLQVASPSEVEEHCEKLIKTIGKNGGFIISAGSSIDCAKPANVKAMVDAAKKYRP